MSILQDTRFVDAARQSHTLDTAQLQADIARYAQTGNSRALADTLARAWATATTTGNGDNSARKARRIIRAAARNQDVAALVTVTFSGGRPDAPRYIDVVVNDGATVDAAFARIKSENAAKAKERATRALRKQCIDAHKVHGGRTCKPFGDAAFLTPAESRYVKVFGWDSYYAGGYDAYCAADAAKRAQMRRAAGMPR